jgi:predicted O-methyltransferase YrrM
MAALFGLNGIKSRVKQLQRDRRFPVLVSLAKNFYLFGKGVRDICFVPIALIGLKRAIAGKTPAECVDIVFDGFGGILRPYQNRSEIRAAIDRIAALRPKSIVEIGTARGGTLFLLSLAAASGATIVSVDLPGGMYGGGYPAWKTYFFKWMIGPALTLKLVRRDSHDPRTVEIVRGNFEGPIDVLFIDADHSYEGVKRDFHLYKDLVRENGVILFHDILENRFDPDISVAPFWRELAARYHAEEIVEDREQGIFGIGLLGVPETWNALDA